jgi:hypothetical protein
MVLYKLKMATRVGFRPRVRCSDVTAQIRSLPLLSCGAAHRYATRRHARLRPPRTFRPHSPGPGGPPGAVGGSRYAACKIGGCVPESGGQLLRIAQCTSYGCTGLERTAAYKYGH